MRILHFEHFWHRHWVDWYPFRIVSRKSQCVLHFTDKFLKHNASESQKFFESLICILEKSDPHTVFIYMICIRNFLCMYLKLTKIKIKCSINTYSFNRLSYNFIKEERKSIIFNIFQIKQRRFFLSLFWILMCIGI